MEEFPECEFSEVSKVFTVRKFTSLKKKICIKSSFLKKPENKKKKQLNIIGSRFWSFQTLKDFTRHKIEFIDLIANQYSGLIFWNIDFRKNDSKNVLALRISNRKNKKCKDI